MARIPSKPPTNPAWVPDPIRKFGAVHPFLFPALVLGLVVLGIFGDVLFSPAQDLILSRWGEDLSDQFYGWRLFGFSQMAQGRLPLWDPYIFCGAPFFAGFQSALLYPPNWAFLVLPPVFALNSSLALHFFLGGFFTYLWLSRYGLGSLPRLYGALLFPLGGAFFLHLYPGHLPNLCTMAWIPLVFLAVGSLVERPTILRLLGLAAAVAMQLLAGHIQYFFYTLFCVGLYGLLRSVRSPGRRAERVLALAGAVALALALTAVQWIPGLEAALQSLRGIPLSPEAQKGFSLAPWNLLGPLGPGLSGGDKPLYAWAGMKDANWWETSLFLGRGGLLLALAALVAGGRGPVRRAGLLMLVPAALALGFYTPLYPFLYDHLPFFHFFRGTYKFCIFLHLGLCFLAAWGLQKWLEGKTLDPWILRFAWIAGTLTLAAAVGLWAWSGLGGHDLVRLNALGTPSLGEDPREPGPRTAVRVLALGGSALVFFLDALLVLLARRGVLWRYLLPLAAAAEVVFFAASHRPVFSQDELRTQMTSIQDTLKGKPPDSRLYWITHDDRALALGVPDILGDDPFLPRRYGYFIAYSQDIPLGSVNPSVPVLFHFPPCYRLLRLQCLASDLKGGFKVIPVPFPSFPRMLLLDRWRETTGDEGLLAGLTDPRFRPDSEVLLESPPDPAPRTGKDPGRLEWKEWDPDHIEVRAGTDRPRLLLMTDNFFPGWRVKALPDSGQRTYSLQPGDYLFRAVPLSAGYHHFLFAYEPASFRLGAGLSLMATALGSFLLLMRWRHGRREARP